MLRFFPGWLLRGALGAALLLTSPLPAQTPRPAASTPAPTLSLQPVPAAIVPTQFYVAAVRDERADRRPVAFLLTRPAPGGLTSNTVQAVDLQGGVPAALQQFVQQSVPANRRLRPLTIRLRECRIQETNGAPGWANGQLALALSFDWQRDGRRIQLTTYTGAARYQRPLNSRFDAAEPVLRQALVEGLKFLNHWMSREAAANVKLATALRVQHADFPYVPEPDTLFYSPAHPLTLADFHAAPRPASGFAGSVFPSFAYTAEAQLRAGVLHLAVQTKVFVVRSSSWVLPAARDAYTLNHEQRHFDVVKLVAERFKRKVTPDSLTLDNYDARMQFQFLQSWREMTALQEQYDAETNHGRDQAAQQRWDQRIEAELRRYGVR
ncbi:hypothetical protein EJV47_13215 [Hymenobacter gummosus]|uniref:DUF922 domain-containing protein n=1 Tax=Hymenobacter gummosus TaxID=1776032 RepID=A0A3S0JE83_9BACT|nr:hypothetical protein [Hymenobacter gummosus]RTQ49763.1 hypothetical protein EJV47_13215 [Hymenobacter gummosus]